jgi:hypothetical protein
MALFGTQGGIAETVVTARITQKAFTDVDGMLT